MMSMYKEVMTDGPTTFPMSLMANVNNVTLNIDPRGTSFFLLVWVRYSVAEMNMEKWKERKATTQLPLNGKRG